MRHHRPRSFLLLLALAGWVGAAHAHQDPCHRLHSCPSDHGTYVCGDKGRCDRCPDNEFCQARKPRVVSSPTPAPAPLDPSPRATTTPATMTVCFTPGANCTDTIVKTLSDAKHTVLVQAYSFTSAPLAKALLEAHKRGVQVQVILDKSQRNEKYSSADFLANQGVPTMRRRPRHCAWQGHDHRRRDRHQGTLQLHQGGAGEERGARVDHPRPSPGGAVYAELGSPPAASSAVCRPRSAAVMAAWKVNDGAIRQRHWLWVLSIGVVT
jgi:PLD-like domain